MFLSLFLRCKDTNFGIYVYHFKENSYKEGEIS